MSRDVFGWDYPAGAENDPNAPFNQPEALEECTECGFPPDDDEQIWCSSCGASLVSDDE